MNDEIVVKGARTHNLNNIDVKIPKNKISVICGVSGSGKSSLAFDTIFAEGQRRYIESLSSYARQFLGQIDKPDVDSIDGLSPSVAIDQKTVSHNPRSTVGTVTEIWDHLRLLYSRIGVARCLSCGGAMKKQSLDEVVNNIKHDYDGQSVIILSPVIKNQKGVFKETIANYQQQGFSRIKLNDEIIKISEYLDRKSESKKKKITISLVIDRLNVSPENENRLNSAIELAFRTSDNYLLLETNGSSKGYSTTLSCSSCNISRTVPEPRDFSFNSPFGSCPECEGLGVHEEPDEMLFIRDRKMSLRAGAITPWQATGSYDHYLTLLSEVCKKYGGDIDTPFNKLNKKCREAIIYGDPELKIKSKFVTKYSTREYLATYEGIYNFLKRKIADSSDSIVEKYKQYFTEVECPSCNGSRLNKSANSVTVSNKKISELAELNISDLESFFTKLTVSERERFIAGRLISEIIERIKFLNRVGLGYLSLSRKASTLSGGEAQRIRLATQIGSGLTGVLYVLDEPSIGLHQRDNEKLINTIEILKSLGNTVLVVEHDEETILKSDYIVEIGPNAGSNGGNLVYQGSIDKFLSQDTLTSNYVNGIKNASMPSKRNLVKNFITVKSATGNNLRDVTANFIVGGINVVTGVSGSGKSTLVNDTLAPELEKILSRKSSRSLPVEEIIGTENLDKIVVIDQSAIGRTPRSNPATYIGIFDTIRNLFADTEESKSRGYLPGRFSFNVPSRNGGGRCESCQGDGKIRISMNFLPDIYVDCDVCKGQRFNRETLTVKYNGHNIADILEMSVADALKVFKNVQSLNRQLSLLVDVGLDYMKLGQSATTLSGGEAQRIKLAEELSKRGTGRTIYILDEPTTGLHYEDIKKLLSVLNKLADKGNTIVIIEHNLDVIASADWVIDLGPEGGPGGGKVIFEGKLESLASENSPTGHFVKKYFDRKNALS